MIHWAAAGLALVLAVAAAPTRGDEGLVRFLQAQPVSRWEMGLYRLEQFLAQVQWADMPALTHGDVAVRAAGGGADGMRIVVRFNTREDQGADDCARAIDTVRDYAGIRDGRLTPAQAKRRNGSRFASFFSPAPGEGVGGAAGYGAKVDPLFVVEIVTTAVRCRGPLLGIDVVFSGQ